MSRSVAILLALCSLAAVAAAASGAAPPAGRRRLRGRPPLGRPALATAAGRQARARPGTEPRLLGRHAGQTHDGLERGQRPERTGPAALTDW